MNQGPTKTLIYQGRKLRKQHVQPPLLEITWQPGLDNSQDHPSRSLKQKAFAIKQDCRMNWIVSSIKKNKMGYSLKEEKE